MKHDYQYGHNKKKYKSRGIKGTLDLFRENLTPRIKERLITYSVYTFGGGAVSFYARGADLDKHEYKDRARDEKLYMPLAMAFAFAQNPYVQIEDISGVNTYGKGFYSDGSPVINVPMNDASCLYFQGV